jgi:hypothetical protein
LYYGEEERNGVTEMSFCWSSAKMREEDEMEWCCLWSKNDADRSVLMQIIHCCWRENEKAQMEILWNGNEAIWFFFPILTTNEKIKLMQWRGLNESFMLARRCVWAIYDEFYLLAALREASNQIKRIITCSTHFFILLFKYQIL